MAPPKRERENNQVFIEITRIQAVHLSKLTPLAADTRSLVPCPSCRYNTRRECLSILDRLQRNQLVVHSTFMLKHSHDRKKEQGTGKEGGRATGETLGRKSSEGRRDGERRTCVT
jgi:hypothetical protein